MVLRHQAPIYLSVLNIVFSLALTFYRGHMGPFHMLCMRPTISSSVTLFTLSLLSWIHFPFLPFLSKPYLSLIPDCHVLLDSNLCYFVIDPSLINELGTEFRPAKGERIHILLLHSLCPILPVNIPSSRTNKSNQKATVAISNQTFKKWTLSSNFIHYYLSQNLSVNYSYKNVAFRLLTSYYIWL